MSSPAQAESLASAVLPAGHGFFTRRGGVSEGPYASLNCSLTGNDAREAVLENRSRAAAVLGADPARLVGLHQVHGAQVVRVTEPWRPGEGARADAMATNRRGIALGIVTADCAPVLFADAEAGVIGAAHAGWRGAVAGVLEATIAAMMALGADARRIAAAVGPCIAQASYEVAADLRDAVLSHAAHAEKFFAPGRRPERWQFDLSGYCAARLAAAGIGAIDVLAVDTLADEARFFSHRRRTLAGGGPIGHQISVIVRPG
ncbi:MAG: peptidoglycan editing factor PgeF [Alphaproteobacteria bacterium]|nr:peptidoglycan editing factor PgeF [Alphaproteobacteria bacterium]